MLPGGHVVTLNVRTRQLIVYNITGVDKVREREKERSTGTKCRERVVFSSQSCVAQKCRFVRAGRVQAAL